MIKRIVFTVTNDLNYDQRMIRICGSLAAAGYDVTLVGRKMRGSPPLRHQPFAQKRLHCFFSRGKSFYTEFSIRLFFYLLFKRMNGICAIDLDTILPCYFVSRLKRVTRIYDAHELFTEMKEVVSRPRYYRFWKRIEKFAVPKFRHGYTVNQPIADEFRKMYNVEYTVIRNLPALKPLLIPSKKEKYILYQGAVNEGRSFETLVPAMKSVNAPLVIAGDGNFMEQAIKLVEENNLRDKIQFKGKIEPHELPEYTRNAWIGITLFESKGLSNYLSLANRFFDYIAFAIPQLCVDYPAYAEINKNAPVAVLVNDLSPASIATSLNRLLEDEELYRSLQQNCISVRETLNWEQEEKKLLLFYQNLF